MKRSEIPGHIVSVAQHLFNQFGYRAVGIDLVVEKSEVAKTTLYRHFPSKEELIVAVLKKVDADFRDEMSNFVEKSRQKSMLLVTFDFLERWFNAPDFFGCTFVCAIKEYPNQNSIVHREATFHKRMMLVYLEELAKREGLKDAKTIAAKLHLLHEGAIAMANAGRGGLPAIIAKEMAGAIIEKRAQPQVDSVSTVA